MTAKAIFVICAQVIFIQSAFSQCLSPAAVDATNFGFPYGWGGRGLAYDGLVADGAWNARGLGCGCGGPGIGFTATSGGGLPVASASAIPPVGVSVASDNMYEGILAAAGELPFVGTVGVEGVLPTAGAGAVNYGCGNGCTGMVSDIAPGNAGSYGAYGADIAGPYGAYGADIASPYGMYGATGIAGPLAGFGTAGVGGPGFGGPGIGGLGIGAPGFGYRGWAGKGCGCAY